MNADEFVTLKRNKLNKELPVYHCFEDFVAEHSCEVIKPIRVLIESVDSDITTAFAASEGCVEIELSKDERENRLDIVDALHRSPVLRCCDRGDGYLIEKQ